MTAICACCNSTHFGSETGDFAEESHWKEKYGYKDNLNPEKIKSVAQEVLDKEGLDRLHVFNHFIIHRYKLAKNNPIYRKETKDKIEFNMGYMNKLTETAMQEKNKKEAAEKTRRYQKTYG